MKIKPKEGIRVGGNKKQEVKSISLNEPLAETQRNISELMFCRLFETAQDGILLLDADSGAITEANPFILKSLGYSHAEMIGKKLWEIGLFKDRVASKIAFKELQKKKYIHYKDLPLQTKSGVTRVVEFVSNVYQVGDKTVIQCNIRDITDRKIIADALQTNEGRYRELFNRMSSCVAVYEAVENGKDFIFKDFNAAAERVEKTPRQKVLGRKVTEVFPGIIEMGLVKTFYKVWKTGKAQSHPIAIYQDAHIFGWRENFVYKLPSGEIVVIYEDATERKKEEIALKLVTESQSQIVRLENLEEVYKLVGNKVYELIGDGYIIVSALDEPSQVIRTKGLFGFGEIYGSFVKQFHIDPSQMSYPLKEMTPDELHLFRSGNLEKFPGGLYRLMLGKVPKSICKFAEKQLGIFEIYTIGFIQHNVHFGGLSILAKNEITFYEPYINMILSQASIAIDRIKSGLELRESEARFRSLYENATVGMYRTSTDGRILMANPTLVKMLGYTSFEELAKRDLNQEGFEPGYPRQVYINQIEQKGELHGIESAWKRKDGSAIFVRESAKTIRAQNGNVLFYEGTVENIDERHQSEIALRESEAHFHGLFENSPISLWEEDFSEVKKRLDVLKKRGITNFHGYLSSHPKEIAHLVSLIKVLDVNQATLRLFNAKQKGDLLKPLTAVLSPQTLFEFQKELNSIAEGKTYFTWETKNQKMTGETIDVSLSWSVIPGHESDLSRVLISMIDITERHQSEIALQESEVRFRSLFENSPICLWEEDFSEVKKYLDNLKRKGVSDIRSYFETHPKETAHCVSLIKILDLNSSALDLLKSSNKADSKTPLKNYDSFKSMQIYRDELALIAEGKNKFVFESKISIGTGEIKDVSLYWSVIPGHEKDLSKVLISIIDITERRRAENELRENEERFRHISSTTSDISYSCKTIQGKDYSIDWMIGATESIIGYSVDEIKAHGCWRFLVIPDDLALFEKHTNGLAPGSYSSCELRLRHKNGKIVTIESFAECVSDEKEPKQHYLYGGLVDISERKREQNALQESEIRFRSLFEDSPIALWEEDFSLVKKHLVVLKEKGISDIRSYLESNPKEIAYCVSLIKVLNVNKALIKLYQGKSRDDMLKMRSGNLSPSTLKSFLEEFVEIAEGKVNFNFESTIYTRNDQPRFVNIFGTTAPGHETDLSRVIISIIDITERRKAENALRENEVRFRSLFEDSPIALWEEDHSAVKNYLDGLKKKGIRDFRAYFNKQPQEVKKCLELVKILNINNSVLNLYNARNKTEILKSLTPIFTEVALTNFADQLAQVAGGKRVIDQETEAVKITGEKMYHLVRMQVAPGFEDSLARVIISVVDITDRKIAEQSLQHELKERTQAEEKQRILAEKEHSQRVFSEALTKNALSLNGSLKTEELLDSIIENIQNVIPFEAASIIMIEKGHGKIVRSIGFAEKGFSSYLEQNLFDYSKYSTIQKMIQTGSYVLIADTRYDSIWVHDDKAPWQILSCVEAPIKDGKKVIGFVTLNSSIPNFYTEEHAHRLMAFTEQVSNAMKNAQLFEDTQRRMRRMNAMTLIDQAINSSLDINVSLEVVLMQAVEQLGVDASDILLVNHVSNSLTFAKARGFKTSEITKSKLSMGAGLSGQAIMERRIISIPDLKSAPESYFRNLLIEKEGFVSYYCVPLITKGLIKGVMEVYFRKPFEADAEWLEFFEMLGQQTAIAINNAELLNSLQISNDDLKNAYDSTLQGWVEALDLRDKENEGHSSRVTDATLRLAIHFNFEDKELTSIKRGAFLHDIGKISISDTILNKPGPLSEEEWKIMRKHPEFAFQLLSKTKYLRDALDIPYCHHEKWDGSGYPRGLKGEAIPLAARIFAVVDVWDALISDRPYRSAWSREKALEYIQQQSGKHFDPQVVKVFIEYLKSINIKTE